MTPLQLANRYMEIFYGEGPIERLSGIFSEEFSFKGPYHEFNTSTEYIESLKSDPPVGLGYKIIEAYENENSACLVYQFSKSGMSTIMSQIFEITHGKISRITLVFDTGAFT
jgi:hypothetical protein